MVPLLNIMLGEIIFGGVGAGMYGMLVMVVLTVFIAGLMVGRTPEYLGKKIEAKDVKLAMLYVLIFALCILGFSAWSSVVDYGTSKSTTLGPTDFPRLSTPSRRRLATMVRPLLESRSILSGTTLPWDWRCCLGDSS